MPFGFGVHHPDAKLGNIHVQQNIHCPDDLAAFADAGVELIPFDTLSDPQLPEAEGLFIDGGFPGTHLAALSANQSLIADIRTALAAGLPAYVECGALMYLARSIEWRNEKIDMVGTVPGDIVVKEQPQGRGYVVIEETGKGPWPPASEGLTSPSASIPAHEFHYARLENLSGEVDYAYRVSCGHGIDGHHDGLLIGNLMACFAHHRSTAVHPWVNRFVVFVREKSSCMAPT